MNSQTIYLYISAVAMIVVLIGFSKNNRKTGWKKTRTTLTGALQALYADLGLGADLSRPIVASQPENNADFTLQLLNLRGALGASTPIDNRPMVPQHEKQLSVRSW